MLTAPYGETYVEIPEPFESYRVAHVDGPSLTGLVVDETDRKALVDWGDGEPSWEWFEDLRKAEGEF